FDGPSVVEGILRLADDRELCRRLGDAGRERIATLCNGPERAAQLLEVWQQARKPKNQRKQKEDRSLL
ncbi:MAG: hypothetical protein QF546_14155, partial [Alphaproteobacteria bacterium]|nr:hypothetical protein [Alphaproteobacteria bacterium]